VRSILGVAERCWGVLLGVWSMMQMEQGLLELSMRYYGLTS